MIEQPLAMMPIPDNEDRLVKILQSLEKDTKFRWAGISTKPTEYMPSPFCGVLRNQKYIFFYKDNTMACGTDIYFFSDSRPKEITAVTELT